MEQLQEKNQQRLQRQQSKTDSLEREIAYLRQMAIQAQVKLDSIHALPAADTLIALTPQDSLRGEMHYVVVGYYLQLNYAERCRALLRSDLQLPTEVLEDTHGGFYVYTRKFSSRKEALREQQRLEQLRELGKYMVGNVWIFSKIP